MDKITLVVRDTYRDGGTRECMGSDGLNYCIDGRIKTDTPGAIYDRYPSDPGANKLPSEKFLIPYDLEKPPSALTLVAAKHARNLLRFPPAENEQFHQNGELSLAAIFTLTGSPEYYPTNWKDWYLLNTLSEMDPVENLVNATALLLADIDRILNQREKEVSDEK